MYKRGQGVRDRAAALGKNIQNFMKAFWVDAVRKFLRSLYVGDFKERIVQHPVNDLLFIKLMGKQVMSIPIKLKPERRPCGNGEKTTCYLAWEHEELSAPSFRYRDELE